MTSTTERSKLVFYCCAILFATYITKFARDLIIPSLPAIAQSFGVSEHVLQLNVAVYFFGITASRLFWPTLADVLNRKTILFICLSIFMISTASSIVLNNAYAFLCSRFFQAFSIAGLPLITRALIFNQSGKLKTIQLFASMSLLATWAPAVATAVGGFIQQHYFWQMQFYLLLLVATVGYVLYLFLPSQAVIHNSDSSRRQHIIRGYLAILSNRAFWRISLPFSLLTAMLAVYYTVTPFLFMQTYQLSPQDYGLLTFIIIGGMTLGMFSSGFLSKRLSIAFIVLLAVSLSLFSSILLLAAASMMSLSIYYIMLCLTLFTIAIGLVSPTVKAQVMEMHHTHSGSVLACLGAIEALTSTIAAAIASSIAPSNIIGFAAILFGLAVLALISK